MVRARRSTRLAVVLLPLLASCATAPPSASRLSLATPEARCEAEKLALTAPEPLFHAAGLRPEAVERWLVRRRGPDGIEGTHDDALLNLTTARGDLGEGALERLLATGRARRVSAPCGVQQVQLLAFNDFHGALEVPVGANGVVETDAGPVPAGGLAALARTLAELASANPAATVVVGAGDMIGATPLISAAFHDEPTIEGLGLAGLAITAVGNHEFDEGFHELLRLQRGGCHPKDGCYGEAPFPGARFRYLAASTVDGKTDKPILPPYEIRRFGRNRVGFIGLTLEGTPDLVRADGITGLRFLDEVETVAQYTTELKTLGVDAIVVLLHEGGFPKGNYRGCEGISGPIVDLAAGMPPEVDVIVSGHTHMPYICDIAGKLVTSAAANGRLVTDIDLTIDEATGRITRRVADNVIARTDLPADPAVEAFVAGWRARVSGIAGKVIGTLASDLGKKTDALGQSDLGGVIADAQLAACRKPERGGAQLAVMNGGGIRAELIRDQQTHGEAVGEVTYGELFSVQPFQNELVTLTLTGAQLRELLEQQLSLDGALRDRPKMLQFSRNLAYVIDASAPPGKQVDIRAVRLDGKPLRSGNRYRLVANAYLATGGDDFPVLAAVSDRVTGPIDLDALVAWFARGAPVTPPAPAAIEKRP
jgi:5'-nucleotidase